MTDIPFHDTRRGRTFYEHDIPKLVQSLSDIAAELKQLNEHLRKTKDLPDGPA